MKTNIAEEALNLIQKLWSNDIKFLMLKTLCEEECSARGIAKKIGVSHTIVNKYLKDMVKTGIVDVLELNSRIKVYRLNENYRWIRWFIKS